eukprot:1004542-Amorphochlora_amoeboformis.AAC.1
MWKNFAKESGTYDEQGFGFGLGLQSRTKLDVCGNASDCRDQLSGEKDSAPRFDCVSWTLGYPDLYK